MKKQLYFFILFISFFPLQLLNAQKIGLQVDSTYSVLFGQDSTGGGTKLLWLPSYSAFRAGSLQGTFNSYWDPDNIGQYSFATGRNTLASGDYSFAAGNNTHTTAFSATALGTGTKATGYNSTALGYQTISNSRSMIVLGSINDTLPGYHKDLWIDTDPSSWLEMAIRKPLLHSLS